MARFAAATMMATALVLILAYGYGGEWVVAWTLH